MTVCKTEHTIWHPNKCELLKVNWKCELNVGEIAIFKNKPILVETEPPNDISWNTLKFYHQEFISNGKNNCTYLTEEQRNIFFNPEYQKDLAYCYCGGRAWFVDHLRDRYCCVFCLVFVTSQYMKILSNASKPLPLPAQPETVQVTKASMKELIKEIYAAKLQHQIYTDPYTQPFVYDPAAAPPYEQHPMPDNELILTEPKSFKCVGGPVNGKYVTLCPEGYKEYEHEWFGKCFIYEKMWSELIIEPSTSEDSGLI